MAIMMSGLVQNSCFHQLSSSECGFVDVSNQIFGDDELDQLLQLYTDFEPDFDPDSIWRDIDDIIAESADVANKTKQQQQPRRKLVRKRKYREVAPAQLDCGYGLERRKRARKDEEFAKPKTYECQYCPSDMLSVHVYLRHLKRHREAELRHRMSRCNGCGSLFNDIIQTKWHQTRCLRRTIVGNL